jgi:drug/metabolite transporter (DMT)-like permease
MPASSLALLVLLAAIWGASFLCMRVAAPEFGVPALIALRLTIATLVLLPFLSKANLASIRAHWKQLLLLGIINSAVPFSLLAFTTKTLSAGLPSIINATVPFFAALVAWAWFREKPSSRGVLGLCIGFAGVFVLVWPKLSAGLFGDASTSTTPASPHALLAIGTGLLAALLYATSAHYTKRVLAGVPSMAVAIGSTACATALALPLGLASMPEALPSPRAWALAAMLGAVCTGVAYIIFYRLFDTIGPTKAVTVTFLIPVFGVLWGTIFLDEPLTLTLLAGGVLVLLGMGLIVRPRARDGERGQGTGDKEQETGNRK